jgi:hypothetical protein
MAVLALSTDLADMRERLGRMVIGNSKSGVWAPAVMQFLSGPADVELQYVVLLLVSG